MLSLVWLKSIYSPKDHPRINKAELDYIEQGGAMVDLDTKATLDNKESKWPYIKQLLKNRMMMGIFSGNIVLM